MSDAVALIKVTYENLREVLGLKVSPEQERFVASNAVSISEAYFVKAAWFRAIEAEGKIVGFVMLFDPSASDDEMTNKEREEMYLWRLMIDARYQGKGYGRAALDRVREHARGRPGLKRLLSSFDPAGAEDFYVGYGFEKIGMTPEGEVKIIMDL